MDAVGRVILRFLVVPLGVVVAVVAGVAVLVIAEWAAFLDYVRVNPDAEAAVIALLFLAPFILMILAGSVMLVLAPAAIGILVAEFFAIRSVFYHAGNGVLSAWVGWTLSDPPQDRAQFFADPRAILVVGLAAGLAYWLIAGWNAGLWKRADPLDHDP